MTQKKLLRGLFDLIETWFLPSTEQIVPEAKKEIKEYVERMIVFVQEKREREIIEILETNLDRLSPKIVTRIAKQLFIKFIKY